MFKNIFIVLMLMLASCTTAQSTVEEPIDAEFKQYVEKFKKLSLGTVTDEDFKYVTIKFAEIDGDAVGTCLPIPYNQAIEIDRGWWQGKSDLEREELVFHELGHCVLWRDHVQPSDSKNFFGWLERFSFRIGILEKQGLLADGCPSSIMHPYVIEESCIKRHYDYYIEELFGFNDPEEYKEEVRKTITDIYEFK